MGIDLLRPPLASTLFNKEGNITQVWNEFFTLLVGQTQIAQIEDLYEIINTSDGFFAGSGATRVQMQPGVGIWCGADAIGDAPFSVTVAGVLSAASGTIGGWTLSATTLYSANIVLDQANDRIRVNSLVIDGANDRIQSDNYVSGYLGSGFTLSPDLLEVGNIACRGIFRTSVFQKDTISVVGGNVLVMGGDVLATDMTADDDSTLTIEGNETFGINDVLRIKTGEPGVLGDDEWLIVNNISNAPTYSVARDKGNNYGTDSNPIWTKGSAVVNYGNDGDGGIYMTSSETNAPYLSVISHYGSPWYAISTKLRLGNLNGFLGYTTDLYGIAIGEESEYLKYDSTNGLRIKGTVLIESGSSIEGVDTSVITGWVHPSDTTKIDGGSIYTNTITADMFISTLYGDLNQAMSYVKTVLGAGDEYSNAIDDTDLSDETSSPVTIDADSHRDYESSVRIATTVLWDEVGAVWDTGTWDTPTESTGSIYLHADLGSSQTVQASFLYTLEEDTPASTSYTLSAIYSTDNINWGTNAAFDDDVAEVLTPVQVSGDIYKISGTLFTFRYVAIFVELATSNTAHRIILHNMIISGNVINLFKQVTGQTIAASGGTTINYSGFNSTPAITVTPVGATVLVPLITSQSSSSATIKLYNMSSTDVGGTCNITMIGV